MQNFIPEKNVIAMHAGKGPTTLRTRETALVTRQILLVTIKDYGVRLTPLL